MPDRISILALREILGNYSAGEFEPVTKDDVLALVEAVEAAQVYFDGDDSQAAWDALYAALARFDFGEET